MDRMDVRWVQQSILRSWCPRVARGFRCFSVSFSFQGEFVLFYSLSCLEVDNGGTVWLQGRHIGYPMPTIVGSRLGLCYILLTIQG